MTDWIDLDGTANTRDVGGLPTRDGRKTRRHRLIRSDNLQNLSVADVACLIDEYEVKAVADLRTDIEVASEGPAPLDERVDVHRLSLFAESGRNTDVLVGTDSDNGSDNGSESDRPPVLPWQTRDAEQFEKPPLTAVEVYLRYLEDRPDSIVQAVRLIAHTQGATIVHCAAGKDRTGVVVALALDEVGVDREAIIADYAASAEHGDALIARLVSSRTYAADVGGKPANYHLPKAESMQLFLEAVDERFGGTSAWLRSHGWTDEDAAALQAALLE